MHLPGSTSRQHIGIKLQLQNWMIVSRYRRSTCAHASEHVRGGSGAWYAMELADLLLHVARGLNIDWDEATQYAGLNNQLRSLSRSDCCIEIPW